MLLKLVMIFQSLKKQTSASAKIFLNERFDFFRREFEIPSMALCERWCALRNSFDHVCLICHLHDVLQKRGEKFHKKRAGKETKQM
jgi:hypothetical protein